MIIVFRQLTDKQRALYDALKHGGEVQISELHDVLFGPEATAGFSPHEQQQRVGAHISRLNRRMFGGRVIPGKMKRTYVLTNSAG